MTTNASPDRSVANHAMSRRGFLTALGGAAAGVGLISASSALAMPGLTQGLSRAAGAGTKTGTVTQDKLGIQIWTCLAEYEADMPHTFDALAQIGYRYVEFAFGWGSAATSADAKAFRKGLDDAGLWCNGGHGTSPYQTDDKTWKQYVEDCLTIGAKYLGANITLPSTKNECLKYIDAVHKGHEIARKMGFKGSLYNHLEKASWELLDGKGPMYSVEFILQHTTPDVWNAEFDTAHGIYMLGTLDACVKMVRKHPGRFPFWHMKDGFASGTIPPAEALLKGAAVFNSTPFGAGDFGRPSPTDPSGRPHDGFQTMLTAIRETQDWSKVLLMAEADGSQGTCADYAVPAYEGLNGLTFPYNPKRH